MFGFLLATSFEKHNGVTPWRLPALIWGLFWFLSPLLGLILYLVARSSGRSRRPQASGWEGAPQAMGAPQAYPQYPAGYAPPGGPVPPPQGYPPVAPAPPGYPAPLPAGPPAAERPQAPAPPGAVAPPPSWQPAAEPARAVAPRSWVADPSGRHELRYWDGTAWTEFVSDAGVITSDPA